MKKIPFILSIFLTISLSAPAQKAVVDSLPGRIKTYYSPGRLNRAKATQQLIQDAVAFYEAELPGKSFSLTMYVVDQVRMPFYNDSTESLTVGTNPNQMAIARLLAATSNSPADTVDIVALHELGHYYQATLHQASPPTLWANEFFATYFAFCYLQTKNLSLLPSASTGISPKYRTLKDFDRLYLGVGGANYGWYQDQFVKLASALYPKFKTRLVQLAVEEYSPTGKKTPPMALLQGLAPHEMKAWLQGLRN